MFEYSLTDLQHDFQISFAAIEKMQILIQQLIDTNQTTNLTAITNDQEAIVKHLYDSLLIFRWNDFPLVHSIIDIGSGAGFPTIPLAICHPDKHFVMVEATQKKINFQTQVAQRINLVNTSSIWGRSEEIAHQKEQRQQYDLVMARAVASAAILAELTIPFAKIGGFIVFYKGQEFQDELENAAHAIEFLGCEPWMTLPFELPLNFGIRNLIILKKVKDTPDKYPRTWNALQKKPL